MGKPPISVGLFPSRMRKPPSRWESPPCRWGSLPSRCDRSGPGGEDSNPDGVAWHPDGSPAHPGVKGPIRMGKAPITVPVIPISSEISPRRSAVSGEKKGESRVRVRLSWRLGGRGRLGMAGARTPLELPDFAYPGAWIQVFKEPFGTVLPPDENCLITEKSGAKPGCLSLFRVSISHRTS